MRPFKLFERHNRRAGKTTYSVNHSRPIPPEFSLIIGDAIHNTRAALDLLLFGMAGYVEPKMAFPFGEDAEKANKAIKDRKIRVAGNKVFEAMRCLQPYPGGKGGALYVLHQLDR